MKNNLYRIINVFKCSACTLEHESIEVITSKNNSQYFICPEINKKVLVIDD